MLLNKLINQMGRKSDSSISMVRLTKAEKWRLGFTIFSGKILEVYYLLLQA